MLCGYLIFLMIGNFGCLNFFFIKELPISIISKSKNHQSPIMVFQKHQRANKVSTIIKMIFLKFSNKLKITIIYQNQFLFGLIIGF